MKRINYIISLLLLVNIAYTQQNNITIEQCRSLAKENWPNFKKMTLINEREGLIEKTLNKNYLPKVTLGARATYQTEVVEFPEIKAPGMDNIFPEFPNDNYRVELQLQQIIYDGGNTKRAKEFQTTANTIESVKIEMSNYSLMDKINKIYLKILLLEQNEAVLQTTKLEIIENIKVLQSLYDNEMILLSDLNKIKAEQLSLEKQILSTNTSKINLIQTLAMMTNADIDSSTVFEIPINTSYASATLPKIRVFEAQESMSKASLEMDMKNKFPTLSLFANGGYGRPGYNFMNTDMHTYAMAGINFSWEIFDWGLYGKKKEKYAIDSKMIEINKEAFVLQNNLDIKSNSNDIKNLEQQIDMDKEIIQIKEEVKKASWSKWKNGAINFNEYLKDLNDLKKAKQTLEINKILLIEKNITIKHLEGVEY